jgi:hypothetical protein
MVADRVARAAAPEKRHVGAMAGSGGVNMTCAGVHVWRSETLGIKMDVVGWLGFVYQAVQCCA